MLSLHPLCATFAMRVEIAGLSRRLFTSLETPVDLWAMETQMPRTFLRSCTVPKCELRRPELSIERYVKRMELVSAQSRRSDHFPDSSKRKAKVRTKRKSYLHVLKTEMALRKMAHGFEIASVK